MRRSRRPACPWPGAIRRRRSGPRPRVARAHSAIRLKLSASAPTSSWVRTALRWLSSPAASAEASLPSCRNGRTMRPGQHPGDGEGRDQRADDEQRAPAEPRGDRREGDILGQPDRYQPWNDVRSRRAGDALDAVRPDRTISLISLPARCRMTHCRFAEVAADPIRTVDAADNDDALLVDDAHDAACGKPSHPECVLEILELGSDRDDRPQSARAHPRPGGRW